MALTSTCGAAESASRPLSEPVLEPATLHSLGAYWTISGDANATAVVETSIRVRGSQQWRAAAPLVRIARSEDIGLQPSFDGPHESKLARYRHIVHPSIAIPDDAWLFAGSVLLLDPDTAYEIRLRLVDPDGGAAERILEARTRREPTSAANAPIRHVVPGDGGGDGSLEAPLKGLAAAQAAAKPGDIMLLHAGRYDREWRITANGEDGRPIVWRGAGDGEAVIGGTGPQDRAKRAIDASGAHDVWFERLSIRDADYGILAHHAQRLVVRRCLLSGMHTRGMTAAGKDVSSFFVSDNRVEGTWPWRRIKEGSGYADCKGIEIAGSGHDVCYNRVMDCADGIDTGVSPDTHAIDFHHNEISGCHDDAFESDYSERNVRIFLNRATNCFQGLSFQPIYGGPVYAFRNALYQIISAPLKIASNSIENPSGLVIFHNTFVHNGYGMAINYQVTEVFNLRMRNNLFIGTTAPYLFEITCPLHDASLDFDGFSEGPWGMFLKIAGERYRDLADVRTRTSPAYQHATVVTAARAFASGAMAPAAVEADPKNAAEAQDLRLKEGTEAIDAGEIMPNDDFAGKAPDLGEYEFGAALTQYGPRTER